MIALAETVAEAFCGTALLVSACHCGWALRVCSLAPLPVLSLCFLCVWNVISLRPDCLEGLRLLVLSFRATMDAPLTLVPETKSLKAFSPVSCFCTEQKVNKYTWIICLIYMTFCSTQYSSTNSLFVCLFDYGFLRQYLLCPGWPPSLYMVKP